MKNLKLELFNFKKNLSLDQEEIFNIIEGHVNACVHASEKSVIASLNEKLKPFTYDKEVKGLLESLNDDIKQYEILYELKNLTNLSFLTISFLNITIIDFILNLDKLNFLKLGDKLNNKFRSSLSEYIFENKVYTENKFKNN